MMKNRMFFLDFHGGNVYLLRTFYSPFYPTLSSLWPQHLIFAPA